MYDSMSDSLLSVILFVDFRLWGGKILLFICGLNSFGWWDCWCWEII
jgi:hypothetical protein